MTDKNTGVSLSKLDRSTWQTVRLGDVCEIISGGTPATHMPEYWDGDIPWLSVVDFNTGNKYVTKTEKSISEAGLQNSSTHLLNTNEIIISARGTVGVLSILSKPMAFNQSCFGLCANSCVCDSDFLYYAMNASIAQMRQNSTMGVFSALTYQGLKSLSFLLPSHAMQKQISHSLSAIDAQISALRRLIAKHEAIKKATLKLLLKPRADWKTVKLGELCEVCSSKRVHEADWRDNGVPFYRAREIVALHEKRPIVPVFISQELYDDFARQYGTIKQGDLLVTGVGSIGVPYLVQANDKFYFKDGNIIWFKNKRQLNPDYFLHIFRSEYVQNQVREMACVGTVGSYTISNGRKTTVLLPPMSEQKHIATTLSTLDRHAEELQAELAKAQNIKQGMMRYFFGD